jgi:hypothetical protein
VKALAVALATALCLTACARHATTTRVTSAAPHATPPAPPATTTPPQAVVRVVPRVTPATARPAAKPAPQILGASVSPTVVGSYSVVSAVVRTTPGVVSVVAHAAGTSIAVPRVSPGLFEGSTTLPALPPFAHGSYAVTFVARDASGLTTQSAVGVTVR